MRKLLSAPFYGLSVMFWMIGDALFPMEVQRAMGPLPIKEPPYSEQDTRDYDSQWTQPVER